MVFGQICCCTCINFFCHPLPHRKHNTKGWQQTSRWLLTRMSEVMDGKKYDYLNVNNHTQGFLFSVRLSRNGMCVLYSVCVHVYWMIWVLLFKRIKVSKVKCYWFRGKYTPRYQDPELLQLSCKGIHYQSCQKADMLDLSEVFRHVHHHRHVILYHGNNVPQHGLCVKPQSLSLLILPLQDIEQ